MRQRMTLLKRIERLEGRKKRRPLPKLVFALDAYQQAGEVTGYRLGNVSILRLAGETADECRHRAFELQPNAPSAATLYGPEDCGQHASGAWPALTPSDALSGPETGPSGHTNPKRG